jgi:hypothetical protein
MTITTTAPWHKASFTQFVQDRLPQLLAARLPLVDYQVTATSPYTCTIRLALASPAGDCVVDYAPIPQPDAEGVFMVDGTPRVVVVTAATAALDTAEIQCVGEQLYTYIAAHLGEAPEGLPWDDALARAWLPLDRWMHTFLTTHRFAQPLDQSNWLARCEHLRSLYILEREKVFTAAQFGRVCPFQKPEGPSLRHVRRPAVGADIQDGRLVIVDARPAAGLSVAASMIPFLEHDTENRILMGANMMRQWLVPPDPEPALIQTGHEPAVPAFWCGRNLLTAFIAWDAGGLEDGLVLSASCAQRLSYPTPVEPGDKLSNRHGTKGVVSQILPDAAMPHLADGTPVEIIHSCMGVPTRGTIGQLREAVLSRVARVEGAPILVPPFQAPSAEEICARLTRLGLPADGMEYLTLGRDGALLQRPSTIGWVYWGRTNHLAQDKLEVRRGQRQGLFDYYLLRDLEAYDNLAEHFNTRSDQRANAATLAWRVARGPVAQAGPPTPLFTQVQQRLACAGIRMEFTGDRLTFRFAPAPGPTLTLAAPVRHPWLRERMLEAIGTSDELPEYQALTAVNARVARLRASNAPAPLVRQALVQLEAQCRALFDVLLTPAHLCFRNRVLFSGRGVIVPDGTLRYDQVGIPEKMAWALFAPLLARELGAGAAVPPQDPPEAAVLDPLMARTWVLLQHMPQPIPTGIAAFHPIRRTDRAIHLHPCVCPLMNADFDGDQAAIFLPLTPEAQAEAGQRLSVVAHLQRDPGLMASLSPSHDAMWGLATLSLTPDGYQEILQITGTAVAAPHGFVTRQTLAEALRTILQRPGPTQALTVLDQLLQRGFAVARASGASISAFLGTRIDRSGAPPGTDVAAWEAYREELIEQIGAYTDYADPDLGVQLLAMKSGARGNLSHHLPLLLGGRIVVADAAGTRVVIPHGVADGLTVQQACTGIFSAHEGLGRTLDELQEIGQAMRIAHAPQGCTVLARAMRAQRPGVVFARAAAIEEVDPLVDLDSRLFVGLPPSGPIDS